MFDFVALLAKLRSRIVGVAVAALLASTAAAAQPFTQQLIVKFRDQGTARRAISAQDRLALLASDAVIELSYLRPMAIGAHVVALDHAMTLEQAKLVADRLATNADIEYAEPDRRLKPSFAANDEFINQQTYLGNGAAAISAFAAWDTTTGSSNVVVAVVDTGVRPHAALAGRLVAGYDFVSDPATGNDGDGRDANAFDPGDWVSQTDKDGAFNGADCPIANSSWHGTAVAGVIGANGNDHAWTAGIDWSARILPVRVLGKCGGNLSDIIDGIAWAAGLAVPGAPDNATPAQVINLSLGDDSPSACGSAEQSVLDAALAHGITRAIVVAAGNDSDNASNHVPANCSGVIAVGATNSTGNQTTYSNFGSALTISAPGGQYPQFDGIYALTNSGRTVPANDALMVHDGTSFSAPMVSGVISLMLAVAPKLSTAQVRSTLISSAKPFPAGSTCTTSLCGAGIVDAEAAVLAAQLIGRAADYTDLWWFGEAFNGTGVSIIDHHDVLFATLYMYAANGSGSWLVMPGGSWNAAHTEFSGAMYSAVGAPFNDYSPPAKLLQAGTLTLQFSDNRNGTLSYLLTNGQSASWAMARQSYGVPAAPSHPDYSDLWWGGNSQDGWGLTINQHFDTVVALWYTYGLDGKPAFYFIPNGTWADPSTLRGPVYATTGTPFGLPYNASQFAIGAVGSASFYFSDASHATFTYTVDGSATQSKPIVRQPF